MDLCGVKDRLGKDGGHLWTTIPRRYGLFRSHASQGVVVHGAVQILPQWSLQGDACQAVHVVVCEGLRQIIVDIIMCF